MAENYYWFYFTDKENNGYSIDQPEEFLSQRSIDRRAWQSLPVTQSDLPLTSVYTDSLETLGLTVTYSSKWLNGVLIFGTDQALIDTLHHISFIDTLAWEADRYEYYYPGSPQAERFGEKYTNPPSYQYGLSTEQIRQLKLDELHAFGYTGKGVMIAVLDAGFTGLPQLPSFTTAMENNQILDSRNFVDPGEDIFTGHSHGMSVSSIIIANWPDTLIGAAPDATLLLAKTENPQSETRLEEYSWIEAAEWADSLGADILNTSLGYTTFDDSTTNYSYMDLDGRNAHISVANGMTAEKGMISVTSAGNSGNSNWFYIGAPADAFDILSVGAVDSTGILAPFSSRGPSYDLRIKPEVSAMGALTAVQSTDGSARRGNGTSYSSPMIAGAAAALWQAYPAVTAKELMRWIIESGSRNYNPDAEYGFGIPSFRGAYYAITGVDRRSITNEIHLYPNPFTSYINLDIPVDFQGTYSLRILDLQGRVVLREELSLPGRFDLTMHMPTGLYLIELENRDHIFRSRIIKN
jgi:subtilisin family serine protease